MVALAPHRSIKFLASDKGFAMQPKSEWHEKAIRWLVKEMHK